MLPQELIDDIIDNVANTTMKFGPQNSLSSCALVCKCFLPRSQMHLFSKIKICATSRTFGNHHKTERSKRTKEFLDILKHRPLITDYIRELHLVVSELDKGYLLDDPNLHSIMEKKQKSGMFSGS
ncbi:hypothetical protein CPB84DRAFT_272661 [Gymnopilus junonius]|uniref:Uncharacterized protein n=1 Tax=Gymnopilus junonius TaxID=109634 RepID=A0A9P5NSM7_GYMJU|nr:hypothetical protein CPB84DRAFT_272661 [Gymnopilus junonius]